VSESRYESHFLATTPCRRSTTTTNRPKSTTPPVIARTHHGNAESLVIKPIPDTGAVDDGFHVEEAGAGTLLGTLTSAYSGSPDFEPLTVTAISNVGCSSGTGTPSLYTGLNLTTT
jgi:hypothetical protein